VADTAILSSKFQISIPKGVRKAQQWVAGTKFAFIPKGTACCLFLVSKADDLAGLAQGADASHYRDRTDRT